MMAPSSSESLATKKRRVSFKTLGCKLNQAETESIASGFLALGWELVEFGQPADATIVNSCTVTHKADRKSRIAVQQARQLPYSLPIAPSSSPVPTHPQASPPSTPQPGLVVITGCYAESYRKELEADTSCYVVGNAQKSRIPSLVEAHFHGEILTGNVQTERDPFGYPSLEPVFRSRAMIKIQDGCDNFCTFCIIPAVRGRAVSRSIKDSVQAIKAACDSGYKEIVLTGVNMSRWQEGEKDFACLVEACLNIPGDFRLRLGSVEPDQISDRFIALMRHPKMTAHIHLCLQSGSEKILLAMRRQYTAKRFEELAQKFHGTQENFNITTDVIVGFPGENPQDFQETVELCTRLNFGHIHCFPYSRRQDTRADRMRHQVSGLIRKERAEIIRKLSMRNKKCYRETLLGTTQEILVEKLSRDADGNLWACGFSGPYVPVCFPLPKDSPSADFHNQFYRVKITSIKKDQTLDLQGILEPSTD